MSLACDTVWDVFDNTDSTGRLELHSNGFETEWVVEVDTKNEFVHWILTTYQYGGQGQQLVPQSRLEIPLHHKEKITRKLSQLEEASLLPDLMTAVNLAWERLCCRVMVAEEAWRSTSDQWI